jgi:RNA 3'-terminal phosphate cyclase (ATP)
MARTMQRDLITLDGAHGEGGGQILRTALALSMVTGRPFAIRGIRANRAKPGLMRQHLTAVRAAQEVCAAEVRGDTLGATELEFRPGPVRPGTYTFAIGTAGSTTLVLQTVLPALLRCDGPSSLVIEGGTHNIHAPSVHFLQRAFLPLLERMGAGVRVELERHGFYPAGGGRIRVEITPHAALAPLALTERGEITARRAVATVAGLSGEIAKRELGVIRTMLGWDENLCTIEQLGDHAGPGNIVTVEIESEHVTEVFTGFGERGVSAERVATRVAEDVRAYLAAGVPVWSHLADQLLLPLALAGVGEFRTGSATLHTTTNAETIRRFLDVPITLREDGGSTHVQVGDRP